MDGVLPTPLAWIPFLLGAAGLYTLLVAGENPRLRTLHGPILAIAALGVVSLLLSSRASWWPSSVLQGWQGATAFVLFAGGGLWSAGQCILAPNLPRALMAFSGACLAAAGLFLLQSAYVIAAVWGVVALVGLLGLKSRLIRSSRGFTSPVYEPALGSIAGMLLAAVLIGPLHTALTANAARTRFAEPSADATATQSTPHDYQLLHHSAVIGFLLIALGGIGYVVRRDSFANLLSFGLMLQGATVAAAAWGSFSSNAAGQYFGIAIIAVLAPQALLLLLRDDRVRSESFSAVRIAHSGRSHEGSNG